MATVHDEVDEIDTCFEELGLDTVGLDDEWYYNGRPTF